MWNTIRNTTKNSNYMAINQIKRTLQESYADYIKSNIKKPDDWDIELFGNFPPTRTGLKNYFSHLIRENKQKEKLTLIHEFLSFNGSKHISEKIEKLNQLSGRLKSIENLFAGKSTPVEDTLNFTASVFDLPIKNITDFKSEQKSNEQVLTSATNEIKDKPPEKQSYRKFVALGSVLTLLLISGFLYKPAANYFYLTTRFDNAKDKLNEIEQLSFKPIFLHNEIFDTDTLSSSESSVEKGIINTEDTQIRFYTNNIYNHKFLYSSEQWSFKTDKNGEDMNSCYGKPFLTELKSLHSYPKDFTTIANEYIWVRFNIRNTGTTPVFVDNLDIKILSATKINQRSVHYNEWTTALPNEILYEFVLNNKATNYPRVLDNKKLTPNNNLHFSFKIRGDKSCNKQIFKFRILVSYNDGKGNRFTIQSDKDYFIGFLNPYQLIKG